MKDYITLKNGQKFRVEINWNSIADFCEVQGLNEISALDNISKLKVTDVGALIWCGVREGERMDGNEFTHTIRDFSAKMLPSNVSDFMAILSKQIGTGEKEKPESKKKAKSLFKKNP